MSLNRYAKRRDVAEPAIIQALEQAHYEVLVLDKPGDLAVRRNSWVGGLFMCLEVKSARKRSGTHVNRSHKAQAIAQEQKLAAYGIPVVTNPLEALRAVGAVT